MAKAAWSAEVSKGNINIIYLSEDFLEIKKSCAESEQFRLNRLPLGQDVLGMNLISSYEVPSAWTQRCERARHGP